MARYIAGRMTGAIGDFGCFSFYPTKNLGALGDAGAVVTDDRQLAAAAREIREYGWRDRYVSAVAGINSRLDPIQAVILGAKLDGLVHDNARRQAIARTKGTMPEFAGLPLKLPGRRASARPMSFTNTLSALARNATACREHLRCSAIGTGIHYPLPVHLHPAYRGRVPVGPGGHCRSDAAAPRNPPACRCTRNCPTPRSSGVIAEVRRFFL